MEGRGGEGRGGCWWCGGLGLGRGGWPIGGRGLVRRGGCVYSVGVELCGGLGEGKRKERRMGMGI